MRRGSSAPCIGSSQRSACGARVCEMCCGIEAGSYLRLIDSCITQLKAQRPSRTCTESKEEEEEVARVVPCELCRFRSPQFETQRNTNLGASLMKRTPLPRAVLRVKESW